MKSAEFYKVTADGMGVALYLYPDGSVANSNKVGVAAAGDKDALPANTGRD
jgi:hypothetical protein